MATVTGNPLPAVTQRILESRDRKRLQDSNRKSDPEVKKARMVKKFTKRQSQKKTTEAEGPTYGAGLF